MLSAFSCLNYFYFLGTLSVQMHSSTIFDSTSFNIREISSFTYDVLQMVFQLWHLSFKKIYEMTCLKLSLNN